MKKETTKGAEVAEEKMAAAAQDIKENLSGNEGKVGGMLHDARVKKGYKIADIAKELYIRASYLEAIENSCYEDIPEPPYGVGFIRSYAEFLGLNSARIVQLFKEETDANAKADNVYVLEPQSEATVPNKKYLLISMLAIIALYVGWLAYSESQNTVEEPVVEEELVVDNAPADSFPLQVEDFATLDETAPAPEDGRMVIIDTTTAAPVENVPQVIVNEGNFVEPSPAAPAEEVPAAGEPVAEISEPAAAPADVKADARVVLKINQETWVEVKDKDKLWISKVLQPGDVYKIPAGEGKILSVGRVGAVEVVIDGKVVPVVTSEKKIGIALDKYLEANH